jgi:hypothetical protein
VRRVPGIVLVELEMLEMEKTAGWRRQSRSPVPSDGDASYEPSTKTMSYATDVEISTSHYSKAQEVDVTLMDTDLHRR